MRYRQFSYVYAEGASHVVREDAFSVLASLATILNAIIESTLIIDIFLMSKVIHFRISVKK